MVFKSLLLLSAYATIACVSASTVLDARQSAPALPSGWKAVGCFSDVSSSRTLKTASFTSVADMTIESCLAFCTPAGYQYAGLEFARECYCDNFVEPTGLPISNTACNMTCTGNSAEICGGPDAISVFSLTTEAPLPAGWSNLGCWTDSTSSRTLKTAAFTSVGDMTIEACAAFCTPDNYDHFGVEFGRECYCDNIIESTGQFINDGGCNMPCTGNPAEICGGADRINIYQSTNTRSLN